MAVPIAKGAAGTVRLTPPYPVQSATAKLLSPKGVELATLVVTLDTQPIDPGTSDPPLITAVDDDNAVTLASTVGLRPGGVVYWEPAGNHSLGSPLVVSEVQSGGVVVFESSPPGTMKIGDAIRALQVSAAIPPTLTATLGVNFRVEWNCTFTSAVQAVTLQETYQDRTMVNVVLTPFRAAVTPLDARRTVDENYSSMARDAGYYRALAERASNRVERKLAATGRLADLVGDRDLFHDAGMIALRIELAASGLVPAGHDAQMYRQDQETLLNVAIDEAVASAWVDRDQSGDAEAKDAVRPSGSIELRRVS